MEAKRWRSKIKKCCTDAGVMQKSFLPVINALAEILARRDDAEEQFQDSGGELIIEYTNKGGATNRVKNPYYVIWNELNTTALAYWKELCLTPSAFKKACGGVMKLEPEGGRLSRALDSLDLD